MSHMRVWWDHTHKATLARPPRKQGGEETAPAAAPTPAPGKAGEGAALPAPLPSARAILLAKC